MSRRPNATRAAVTSTATYTAAIAKARPKEAWALPPAAKASSDSPGNQRDAPAQACCVRCSAGPAHAMPMAKAIGTERVSTATATPKLAHAPATNRAVPYAAAASPRADVENQADVGIPRR